MPKQILVKEDDEVFKYKLETSSKHNLIKDLEESHKATLICGICEYSYGFVS